MSDGDEVAEIDAIARRFVTARGEARALPDYPGAMPASLDTAYAIQDRAIAPRGKPIGAWKVGRVLPPLDAHFGTTRIAGPIFADTLVAARDGPAMPVFVGGFGAIEAEFPFRLGDRVDPMKQTWSIPDALDHVVAVHVGFEIASSPFPGINQHGPSVTASDFGNNHGLVIGPPVPDWREAAIDSWEVSVEIDGKAQGSGRASAFPGGCAESVRFLLENLAARGIPVPPATWISTGAVSGVHEIVPGQHATADFGGRFALSFGIAAAVPGF